MSSGKKASRIKSGSSQFPVYKDREKPAQVRVKDLLSRMHGAAGRLPVEQETHHPNGRRTGFKKGCGFWNFFDGDGFVKTEIVSRLTANFASGFFDGASAKPAVTDGRCVGASYTSCFDTSGKFKTVFRSVTKVYDSWQEA
jgi:hypothetical protein